MASVTPSFAGVTPQWLQTTQPMITSSFLDATGLGWSSTATAAGSTTTLIDAGRLQMPYANKRNWLGSYVRMIGGTEANLGQVRQVQSYDPNTGTVGFSPALPSATADEDTYEMWNTSVPPQTVTNLLDRLVSQNGLALPTYSLLSEVPDFDMEQSGTAAWTSTNATIAKVPWTASTRGISGKQALGVTTTAANGYATCANPIAVRGGTTYWLSAQFTPANPSVANHGFVQFIDVVTGAEVDRIDTSSKATTRLWKPVANSSRETTLINVRFGSQESGVTGHWDDVVVLDAEAMDAPLPYWMGTESAFKEAYVWRPVVSGVGQQDFDPALMGYPAQGWRPFTDVFSNGGQLRLRGQGVPGNMMYVYGVRNETAWGSGILETKRIDVQWATSALALQYWIRMKGQTVLDKQQDAAIVAQINWWKQEFMENDRRVRSFARTQESPIMSWVKV